MKAVIIAGGKGERLKDISKDIPKPLVKIGGKPVIEHQILLLKKYGVTDIYLLLGYNAKKIIEYFKNKELGCNLNYYVEKTPLGTGGCFVKLKGKINDDFIALSGDIFLDIDFKRIIDFHKAKNADATIVTRPSDHIFDSDLVEVDNEYRVTGILLKPHPSDRYFRNIANTSIYCFSPAIFDYMNGNKMNMEKQVLKAMLRDGRKIYAYLTSEYIKDMGTPERLNAVRKDFIEGKPAKMSFSYKKKAIFLDRDGTINKYVPNLNSKEKFFLLPKVAEAINMLNNSEYLVVVITNQPAVAKGFCSIEDVEEVNKKMETLFALKNAKIDRIYYCIHHPEKGFEGERPELKIDCECRKPKIGMLKQAASDMNIDLSKSIIIGDSTQDILTGKNGGLLTIGVKTGLACEDKKYNVKPDYMFQDLFEAVEFILNRKEK